MLSKSNGKLPVGTYDHRERRVDGLQAHLVGHVRLLLEAEVAAADEDDAVAAAVLEQQPGGVARRVVDLRRVVLALRQARVLGIAGPAVAVPEDVGVLLDEVGERVGDLARPDRDHIDPLFGDVRQLGGSVLGGDVVDDDRRLVPVLLRELLDLGHERLVVGAVVAWSGGGHAELHGAVAVGVEGVDVARRAARRRRGSRFPARQSCRASRSCLAPTVVPGAAEVPGAPVVPAAPSSSSSPHAASESGHGEDDDALTEACAPRCHGGRLSPLIPVVVGGRQWLPAGSASGAGTAGRASG